MHATNNSTGGKFEAGEFDAYKFRAYKWAANKCRADETRAELAGYHWRNEISNEMRRCGHGSYLDTLGGRGGGVSPLSY